MRARVVVCGLTLLTAGCADIIGLKDWPPPPEEDASQTGDDASGAGDGPLWPEGGSDARSPFDAAMPDGGSNTAADAIEAVDAPVDALVDAAVDAAIDAAQDAEPVDSTAPATDAGPDVAPDEGTDATNLPDATVDAGIDSGTDAGVDAAEAGCGAGSRDCAGTCVLLTDIHNCGSCGHDCAQLPGVSPTGLACSNGTTCTYQCQGGYTDCAMNGTGCASLADPHTCGSCGHDCSQLPGVSAAGLACNSGTCTYQCQAGYSDCAMNGTGCASLSQNPNCGACKVSYTCMAGGCNACNPVQFAKEGSSADPFEIAVDSSHVYWTSRGAQTVSRCAIGGCGGNPTTLVSGQGQPNSIATDGTNVYFTTTDSILKCAVGGCSNAPTTLASGQSPGALALGGATLYWIKGSTSVQACATVGCSMNPTPVSTGQTAANYLAADGTNLYWVDGVNGSSATLEKCPLGGCGTNPTPIGTGINSPYGIALDGSNVYTLSSLGFGQNGQVLRCPISGCGSMPVSLAMNQNEPYRVATDGANVYWTNGGDGTIKRCAVGGCASPVTVAQIQGSGFGIAVDGAHIYWTDQSLGYVMQLDK